MRADAMKEFLLTAGLKLLATAGFAILYIAVCAASGWAARIKDIAHIEGFVPISFPVTAW